MDQKKILIADDSELNRALLVDMLGQEFEVIEVADGKEAVAALRAHAEEIAVLLLDVVMPEMDGFAVLDYMNRHGLIESIPVIMISAETGSSYIDRALQLGAADYVSRPFVPSVIRRRILNTILLHTQKQQLLGLVADRFYRKEKNNDLLVEILGYAMECRSGEGGAHRGHINLVTGLLLQRLLQKTDRYRLEQADVEAIRMAAPLHDIGKLLIPEEVLTKSTALTAEEYEMVKRHPQLGATMIRNLPIYQNERLVKYAIEICRWHHERWNGEGYPDGLSGDAIPIAAQTVGLANVYDALTSEHGERSAFSHSEAMEMIRRGECGSFNPLLMECLEDMAPRLEKELTLNGGLEQGQPAARRVVEELYHGSDSTAARTAIQLEGENAKRRFFNEMTRELWFEYTPRPAAISFSAGSARLMGLPPLVVDPLKQPEFMAEAGEENVRAIRERVENATADETYFEMEVELHLNGAPCWCQLAVMIVWSATPGQYAALMGKVVDIDRHYRHMLEMKERMAAQPVESVLLPVLPEALGEDKVLQITGDQVPGLLRGCRRLFQIARLVNPTICVELADKDGDVSMGRSRNCFAMWNRKERCDRCVSREVLQTRQSKTKIETRDNKVFYVLASYLEVDGIPYSLELANQIHSEDMLDSGDGESLLNQLLVRNRQVYTDSLTKIHNRRYFDDQIRNREGTFAFAIIDLDNFKQVNDQYGHLAGDAALYRTAQAIKTQIRSNDELVRYGGDEFFLLFHNLPAHMLQKKLDDIGQAVHRVEFPDYPGLSISASIGGAYAKGRIADILRKADLAMYQAKEYKNCAATYNDEEKNHES